MHMACALGEVKFGIRSTPSIAGGLNDKYAINENTGRYGQLASWAGDGKALARLARAANTRNADVQDPAGS
jgi:hypothetical protein